MQEKTNSIPSFDERGNLPSGIFKATIDDVITFFGGNKSLKRKTLGKSLRDFYSFVKPFAKVIYVDGSFVTSKLSPNDIDLFVIISNKVRQNLPLYRSFAGFLDKQGIRKLHVKVCFETELDNIAYWENWYTRTRKDENGNQFSKGIISLELTND